MTDRDSLIIGRTVHYVSHGSPDGTHRQACRAAIITAVPPVRSGAPDDRPPLSLFVVTPQGQFHNDGTDHDPGRPADGDTELCTGLAHRGGTWHQP